MAAPRSPAPLSSFEKLPIELYREILDHGANPAMVFCSRHLHTLLLEGSDALKKQLIRACFLDERVQKYKPNTAHYNLRMLMREPWLTLKWLLEVKAELLIEQCDAALQEGLPKFPEIPVHEHKSIREKAAEHLRMDTIRRYHVNPNRDYGSRALSLGTWGFGTNICLDWDQSTYGLICIRRPDGLTFSKGISFEMPLRNLGVFPAKLLRGPWTQTQGDILSFFAGYFDRSWSRLMQIYISPKHMNDMQAGLAEALRTQNLCVLFLFGGRLKSAFFNEWRGLHRLFPSERTQVSSSHTLLRQIESPAFAPTRGIEDQPWDKIRVISPSETFCVENIFPDRAWTNEHSRLLLRWLASIGSKHIAADIAHAAHPMNRDDTLNQAFMAIRMAPCWPELRWYTGTDWNCIDDQGHVDNFLDELEQKTQGRLQD